MGLQMLEPPPTRRGEVPDEQEQSAPAAEDRVLISGRVRASVRRRMKLYAAAHDVNLQDLLDEALDEFLRNRNA